MAASLMMQQQQQQRLAAASRRTQPSAAPAPAARQQGGRRAVAAVRCLSQQQQQLVLVTPPSLPQPQQQQPLTRRPRVVAARACSSRSRSSRLAVACRAVPGEEEVELDPNIPAVDQDFDLLGAEVKRLTGVLGDELKGCSIYLIGMMGTGKSTTGKMLANTLKYAFFDTDAVIEMAHPGETVADLFRKYGEDYFRDCESQVLKELAPYKSLIVATGGGAVTRPRNWSYMHNGVVCWLKGEPEMLARRVVAEGVEKRPLLFGEGVSEAEAYDISLGKLRALLDARTKFYENADVSVDLKGYGKDEAAGAPTAVVMHRLMEAVLRKIEATRDEREARRQFTIERAGEVPSLKRQQSPAVAAQQQQQQQQQQAGEPEE